MDGHIDRREIPKAHSFTLTHCEDPDCGPHIIGNDQHGPLLEIVMNKEQGMQLAMGILAIVSGKVGK